jgi:methyltransferase FkbM-like protein
MKCDVEGAEVLVIRGARLLLARDHPTLVCEVSDRFMARYAMSGADLRDELHQLDYAMYAYEPDLHRLRKVDAEIAGGNYVFIHARRIGRFGHLIDT